MSRPSAKRFHNLPAHRVRLIGREQDLVAAREAFAHAEGRLMTLTGAGGCGKTRLALELASTLLKEFPDGVWLVELAPLASAALLPQLIVTTVGLHERAGEPLVDTLIDWIGARTLVLILDNCEHLIDASAGLVERLLDSCANLRMLITSREPLRIPGERIWAVTSLAVPDPGLELDALLACPAVELFVERVRGVRSDFVLTNANERAVGTICRRLEGMPLALELAAARARTLGVGQILERLDNSIGLLVGGSRTAPTRQQTMRATLDWSYRLLSDAEQSTLRGLSVFAASASLEAVEAVCGESELDSDVLEALDHLVGKSLVRVAEHDERTRYRLLEPVREYAREQLLAIGANAAVRRRHLLYCVGYAERREADANVGGPRRIAATTELEQEYPNIRLAFAWAIEGNEAQLGLRLARTVQFFWQARGYWSEGATWLEQLLALPEADEATPAYIVALLAAGRITTLQLRLDVARAYYERGLPLARQASEPWVRWLGPQNVGLHALAHGDLSRATELMHEARAVAQAASDRVCEGISLGTLAIVAWYQANSAEARALAENSLRVQRQTGDEWALITSLGALGRALCSLGEMAAGRLRLEEALKLSRAQGDPVIAGYNLDGLGLAASMENRLDDADACFIESLDLKLEVGAHDELTAPLDGLAMVAAQRGQSERALHLAGAAAAIRQRSGQSLRPVHRQMQDGWLVRVHSEFGEPRSASVFAAGMQLSLNKVVALAHAGKESIATSRSVEVSSRHAVASTLTSREHEVAHLLARGLSNRQIANELVISARTAQRHVENILGKLGFGSRAQVAAWAVGEGLVPSPRAGYGPVGPSSD